MLEALDLSPGMRVLEVGAGTGYNAALIAVITGGPVVTVDSSGNIAAKARQALSRLGMEQQVTVVHGDGYGGHSTAAPYDRIVVTCGCVGFSPYWLEQLAENGLVLAPVAHGGWHPVVAIADPTRARMMIWSDFMPASGPLSDRRLPMLDTISSNVEFTPHTHVGPALDWDGYMSLWCFLGARDPRTTRVNTEFHGIDAAKGMCALNDPRRGIAWIQMDGTIHVTGDAALLDEVMRLVEEWETLGRPSVQDWTCTLSRSGAVLAPARWSLG
jgi:protein-L-isoaspartate(D-aspartate) O-methyltransferase